VEGEAKAGRRDREKTETVEEGEAEEEKAVGSAFDGVGLESKMEAGGFHMSTDLDQEEECDGGNGKEAIEAVVRGEVNAAKLKAEAHAFVVPEIVFDAHAQSVKVNGSGGRELIWRKVGDQIPGLFWGFSAVTVGEGDDTANRDAGVVAVGSEREVPCLTAADSTVGNGAVASMVDEVNVAADADDEVNVGPLERANEAGSAEAAVGNDDEFDIERQSAFEPEAECRFDLVATSSVVAPFCGSPSNRKGAASVRNGGDENFEVIAEVGPIEKHPQPSLAVAGKPNECAPKPWQVDAIVAEEPVDRLDPMLVGSPCGMDSADGCDAEPAAAHEPGHQSRQAPGPSQIPRLDQITNEPQNRRCSQGFPPRQWRARTRRGGNLYAFFTAVPLFSPSLLPHSWGSVRCQAP